VIAEYVKSAVFRPLCYHISETMSNMPFVITSDCICILRGGTCRLCLASVEAASWASPMHDPRGGTSV